jgi:hypothetical protein
MELGVDTTRLRELATVAGRAHDEARAVVHSPELARHSMAAMALDPVLGSAGQAFLDAWHESLEDAARELDWLAGTLRLVADGYDAVEQSAAVELP